MAFEINGWKTASNMGSPTGLAGTVRNMHTYVTNDTLVQIAAADYFLPMYQTVKMGDVIIVSADVDGAPAGAIYVVVTSTSAGLTVSAFA